MLRGQQILRTILRELRIHAPFTTWGTLSGIVLMILCGWFGFHHQTITSFFWTLHPLHVLTSAMATAGMFRLHNRNRFGLMVLIGYVGSIGISTLSDSVIPYFGEYLLDLPNRAIHIGFIEKWWMVNPLAVAGIMLAYLWPKPSTRFPPSAHVLLSTWASLFHVLIAMDSGLSFGLTLAIGLFLFLSVWVPCCTSDIVFPLMFSAEEKAIVTKEAQSRVKREKHAT